MAAVAPTPIGRVVTDAAFAAPVAEAEARGEDAQDAAARANAAADRVEDIEPNLLTLLATTDFTHVLGAGSAVTVVNSTDAAGYDLVTITWGL